MKQGNWRESGDISDVQGRALSNRKVNVIIFIYTEWLKKSFINFRDAKKGGKNKETKKRKKKKKAVCLRPQGRSENFIKARFIIHNTTVFLLFFTDKVITFTIYNYNCA